MINLDFKANGIAFRPNFLASADIVALKIEAARLFKFTSILGNIYCVRLSPHVCELPNPASKIQSVNLLETAIDIHSELLRQGFRGYKLAHIALYQEKGNPNPLLWHSDIRDGALIRAQICIKGGQLDSGAFRYVKDSNKSEITMENWAPTDEYLQKHADSIITCNVPNGSLILIDTKGYHSKCPCINERISLMFDFLPQLHIDKNPNDIVSDILLPVSRLSDKVHENLSIFMTGIPTTIRSPNTYDYYKFFKPFAGSNAGDFLAILRLLFERLVVKFSARLAAIKNLS